MTDNNIRILSTRPIEGALVEKALLHNITFHALTFIEIKSSLTEATIELLNQLSKQKATIVFTSMNAVEVVVEALQKNSKMPEWRIYCLSGASFNLVRKYWPSENICATGRNATELAETIAKDKVENVTFFCGNLRREELPELLKQNNIVVTEVTVYETFEIPTKIETTYNGILFFSPSAVHSYFSINTIGTETILFAIGNTTAKAIKQFCSNDIIISDFPGKEQLADKAIEHFVKTLTA